MKFTATLLIMLISLPLCAMHFELFREGELERIVEERLANVENPLSLNSPIRDNINPLLASSVSDKYVNLTRSLLVAGADPDVQNRIGQTPLTNAVEHLADNTVETLLIHRANPNIYIEAVQSTPLVRLCNCGYDQIDENLIKKRVAIAKLLIKHGANPNDPANDARPLSFLISEYPNFADRLPAEYAANFLSQRKALISILVRGHLDIYARDPNGKTALEKAMAKRKPEFTRLAEFAEAEYNRLKNNEGKACSDGKHCGTPLANRRDPVGQPSPLE